MDLTSKTQGHPQEGNEEILALFYLLYVVALESCGPECKYHTECGTNYDAKTLKNSVDKNARLQQRTQT